MASDGVGRAGLGQLVTRLRPHIRQDRSNPLARSIVVFGLRSGGGATRPESKRSFTDGLEFLDVAAALVWGAAQEADC
jgi:hypothetical protein